MGTPPSPQRSDAKLEPRRSEADSTRTGAAPISRASTAIRVREDAVGERRSFLASSAVAVVAPLWTSYSTGSQKRSSSLIQGPGIGPNYPLIEALHLKCDLRQYWTYFVLKSPLSRVFNMHYRISPDQSPEWRLVSGRERENATMAGRGGADRGRTSARQVRRVTQRTFRPFVFHPPVARKRRRNEVTRLSSSRDARGARGRRAYTQRRVRR